MKKSLQNKITLSIFVVGLISTVLGLWLVYYFGKLTLKKTIGSGFAEIADITSQKLESLIDHHIEEARFLSSSQDIQNLVEKANHSRINPVLPESRWNQLNDRDPEVKSILQNEGSQYLRSFETRDHLGLAMHYFIFATDQRGIVVAANKKTPHLDYHQEKWWQITSSEGKGKDFISDIVFEPSINAYTFNIATPIYKNGVMIGVFNMVHNADTFFKWVTFIKTGKKNHTMLVSSDGTILFCPIFPTKTHKVTPELQEKIFKPEPGWTVSRVDVHYPGQESLNGFAPLEITFHSGSNNFGGKNWYVFTSQDPSETFAPVYSLLKWILSAGFMGIVLLTFLGWFASKRIVKPIRDLQKGIQTIGNGHLDYRINVKTGDEIEELGNEFNQMAKKMQTLYQGLEQKVSERTIELESRTKELELRNNEMYTLFAMGAALNECESREEILAVTPSKVMGMLKADGVLIALFNHPPETFFKSLPTSIIKREETKPLYQYIMNTLREKPEPFIIENTSNDKEIKEVVLPQPFEYVTIASVPLLSKRAVVGGLTLFFKKPHPLTAQEEELLVSLGHQIGNAIENVRLSPVIKRPKF
ncbi:MAG: HAMP domain-containing protein [Nitrospiria bacterium]